MDNFFGAAAAVAVFVLALACSGGPAGADIYAQCNTALHGCQQACGTIQDPKLARDCENGCLAQSKDCALKASTVPLHSPDVPGKKPQGPSEAHPGGVTQ
jgi:hypothetical protein